MNQYIEQFRLVTYLIAGYLIGCSLGLLVIQDNFMLLLLAFSLPLGLILFFSPRFSLYVILFSVFFIDWLMHLDLIPPEATLVPELALLILTIRVVVLKIQDKKFAKTPINIPILIFILWGFLSALINSQHIVTTIIGFRFDLKYILMFFLLVNLDLDEQFFKRIIYIVIILLLIQVPVAVVKLQLYGQGEWAIGTYAGHGGIYSTMLPLIAISIFLGLFLYEKHRWGYVFFSLLFILFSIVGGKRAFVFFGLLLFLFLFWQAGKKNLVRLLAIAPLFLVALGACVYFIPTLKPAFKDPKHIVDYTVAYSTAHSRETGKAIGRTSAMMTAYSIAKENPVNLLFGFGPGSLAPSYFKEFEGNLLNIIPIRYGFSQWVTMSLEYGWVGVLLFLWLFIPLFRVNQKFFHVTNDNYWKAISFGFKGILFTYLMGFFYSVIFRLDLLGFIFWLFAATIYCMGKKSFEVKVL